MNAASDKDLFRVNGIQKNQACTPVGYRDVIMNVLGPAGSGRCFELLMMRNWYSLCDMLITYPYYNFPDLKIDWTDDSWIYDEYNDP
ncbi:hypothetical protein DMN91_007744 [Ooceraea biroi]|uniref:Uncharacterized protein n=1 Tax=Ooceraea biroi TaxID=2015173 RepID=A0A3L8DFF2_OOCBI|nr:hypothetical protein DMN91_007744 [Ooceraea biroi]